MFKMNDTKAIVIAAVCILGSLFLAMSDEEQIPEKNSKAVIEDVETRGARIREEVSNVKAEHEAMSKKMQEKREEIDARSNLAEIEERRAEMKKAEAEMDAVWGKEKPREYK